MRDAPQVLTSTRLSNVPEFEMRGREESNPKAFPIDGMGSKTTMVGRNLGRR